MTGIEILDGPHKWAGRYIPVARMDPIIYDVEGEKKLSGLVSHAKGPQQLHDYYISKVAEFLALAPISTWIATPEQMSGYENLYASAHTQPPAYLPYNHIDGVPRPDRVAPPQIPTGFFQGAQMTVDGIKAVTNIHDSSLGAEGQEVSGVAIRARQNQSDRTNFVYQDNQNRMIRCLGKILVDLIPKTYDTERILRVRGEDGEESQTLVNQRVGDMKMRDLSQGQYDVEVISGPSFASRQLEQSTAVMELMRSLPPPVMVQFLDLAMSSLNFPDAEKWAERAKATLPPGLNGQPVQPPAPDPVATAKAKLTEAQARKTDAEADVAELEAVKHSADTAQYAMMQAQGATMPQPIQPAPTGQVG